MKDPDRLIAQILSFGRLLHDSQKVKMTDQFAGQIQKNAQELELAVEMSGSSILLQVFEFSHCGKHLDPLALRAVAVVAYATLISGNRLGIPAASKIATIDGDLAQPLKVRQKIFRLCMKQGLTIESDYMGEHVTLGPALQEFFQGGSIEPLEFDDDTVRRTVQDAQARSKRSKRKPAQTSAQILAVRMHAHVVGLQPQVRTVACRLALHLRRAEMIRRGNDPKTPNETLLFIGPSGCGKTYLVEVAGRMAGVPFGGCSATDITCEGYVGLDVDEPLKHLLIAAEHDPTVARHGIVFYDEFDKKRSSQWGLGSRDVAGASVQQGVLRLIEGADIKIGGRRSGWDSGTMVNTRGMFFIFAGAFVGLDRLVDKHIGVRLGFGAAPGAAKRERGLYDALEEYGMIPEFINRLTGILVFPAPTVDQLVTIAEMHVLPAYNRLLEGCDVGVTKEALRVLAGYALENRTYARGVKAVVSRLVEQVVFDEVRGKIRWDVPDVKRVVEDAGWGSEERRSAD